MNTIYELPPMLTGSAEQQLRQLRDYLVRLARELPTEAQIAHSAVQAVGGAAKGGPDAVQTAMTQAQNLKALIVKTADEVHHEIDRAVSALSETYLAVSDFGSYAETVQTTIEQTARAMIESYHFSAAIRALGERNAALESSLTQIGGEIRRGFVPDPERVGEHIFGIAVAQKIVTTGASLVNADDGLSYDGLDLAGMQALGLYTSTGWQFWINGRKAGWFDAADGMLHVPQIVVEESLQIGDDWLVTSTGGFGIRYAGA